MFPKGGENTIEMLIEMLLKTGAKGVPKSLKNCLFYNIIRVSSFVENIIILMKKHPQN